MIHYVVGRNLGHLTRCVANVSEFAALSKEPVKIYTFADSHHWLRSNLPKVQIKSFSKQELTDSFHKLMKANLMLHDWREEMKKLKELREGNGPIICGVYHSDIAKSHKDTEWTIKFKQQIQYLSNKTTDVFFHINLTQPDVIPNLSTKYVPIPLIARQMTLSPEEVKNILGIPQNEPFILVQMGGGIGKYRYQFIKEWYEKVNKLRIPYRIVVANQLEGAAFHFHKRITQAPLFTNGRELVNAAAMVISKPGMGILMDCISTGTPLLALPADTKEREVKNMMLQKLVGNDVCLASQKFSSSDLALRIEQVLTHTPRFENAFKKVPINGAEIIAKSMKLLSGRTLDELPDLYEKVLGLSPFKIR